MVKGRVGLTSYYFKKTLVLNVEHNYLRVDFVKVNNNSVTKTKQFNSKILYYSIINKITYSLNKIRQKIRSNVRRTASNKSVKLISPYKTLIRIITTQSNVY